MAQTLQTLRIFEITKKRNSGAEETHGKTVSKKWLDSIALRIVEDVQLKIVNDVHLRERGRNCSKPNITLGTSLQILQIYNLLTACNYARFVCKGGGDRRQKRLAHFYYFNIFKHFLISSSCD